MTDKEQAPADQTETEDQMARRKLGPLGVPGGQDTVKMTRQAEEQLPKSGKFDGHTA